MRIFRAAITCAVFVTIGALSNADPLPKIHYAPTENLERIDVRLIDTAQKEIDLAAYGLLTGQSLRRSHGQPIEM
jgi:hypothetical protein